MKSKVTFKPEELRYLRLLAQQYPTVQYGRTCPHCQSPHTHLVQGNEMLIKEVEAVEGDNAPNDTAL